MLPLSAQAKDFVSVELEEGAEVITLDTGDISSHKEFFLANPNRLVVDVPLADVPRVSLPRDYAGKLLARTRVGRFDKNTVRIVFELTGPTTLVSKDLENGELTLSLSVKGAKAKPKKPLVVIDAGHGGDDPGAIGSRGTQEKDVVLAFAKALETSLNESGKYRAVLTRDSDIFIPLHGRVKIGRVAKGDIFISLHADSAPGSDARGLSVYTLSEKASDLETEKLAAHENKSDIIGGMDLSGEREDVADILISLAQRETRNKSAVLADFLAASLGQKVRLLEHTHRFAGFAVLKAPDIPSVLIETGFISNSAEEKLLKTSEYRQKLVAGIMGGLDRYFAQMGK